MGLSTVSQNLNLLENEGLIEKNGYFDSTEDERPMPFRLFPGISEFPLVLEY